MQFEAGMLVAHKTCVKRSGRYNKRPAGGDNVKTTIKLFVRSCSVLCLLLGLIQPALAQTAYWTDWTQVTTAAPGVLGTLTVGSSTVDVTFSGAYSFAQTSGGTNYWNPSAPYISSAVANAPPASDIIALSAAGTATITFSAAVQDPLLGLVSWNTNTVDFGVPIEILSYGQGFFGNGTPILNLDGDGFFGSGEVHGVIRLPGSYTSITFTHTSENWHGFTVGVVGLGGPPPNGVPEPATLLLFGAGLVGLVGLRRRIGS
jgi:hypothetical protein